MKQNKQRIAIAEACGATWVNVPPKPENGFTSEYHPKRLLTFTPDNLRILPLADPKTHDSILVPDYLNDLNAMHEAEKVLSRDPYYYQIGGWGRFLVFLATECGERNVVCSTAAQRAKAFLRTFNLWTDEP